MSYVVNHSLLGLYGGENFCSETEQYQCFGTGEVGLRKSNAFAIKQMQYGVLTKTEGSSPRVYFIVL